MKWLLLTVGKPALAYAKAGRDEYLARLAKFAPLEQITVKATDRARESANLLARSEGCFRIVLHERGTALTSRALAASKLRTKGVCGSGRGSSESLSKTGCRWSTLAANKRKAAMTGRPTPSFTVTRHGSERAFNSATATASRGSICVSGKSS
jgi:hypothetical protein